MDESAAAVLLNCLNMVGWWVIYPVQHNQIRFMICLAKTFLFLESNITMCIKVHWINCYDNICCINLTPISVVIFTAPLQPGGRQARCQTPQPRSWWTCCFFQPCWMLSSCPLCPDTSSSLQGLQQLALLPPMWDLWVVMVQKKVRKARSSSGRLGWALPPCLTSGVLLFSDVAISGNVMSYYMDHQCIICSLATHIWHCIYLGSRIPLRVWLRVWWFRSTLESMFGRNWQIVQLCSEPEISETR